MRENVLVTGITSFLGFHLASGFIKAGHSVVGTTFRPRDDYSGVRRRRLESLDHAVALEQLDLTDGPSVQC